MPDYSITIRRQHRRSMMIRAVPGGFEVFIPRWMRKDNPKVRAFIQSGIEQLGGQVIPVPAPKTSRAEILRMVKVWAARMGVHPQRVQFREMTRKWGSCSSVENITLNTRLTWLPARLVEYVVVHELVHLRVFNHGKEFKAMMSQHLPDWQERERELDAINFASPLSLE
jgi:predicted metal-dependent hydrolase